MDHNQLKKGNTAKILRISSRKYAKVRFSDPAVVDEMRTLFIREIEVTAPEVLEKLRDDVWPEYISAYNAAKQPGTNETNALVRFTWPPSLLIAVLAWAKEVRLLHKGKPPSWVLEQLDVTLHHWTRYPDLVSKSPRWILVGGYSAENRGQVHDVFSIELPKFVWQWAHGFEDKNSAKRRIMKTVGEIVDKRLGEMEQVLGRMPQLPNKRRPEHFTWTVLNQVQGVELQELARTYKVAYATVKNEVMALKNSIGISLPKGRRPRGKVSTGSRKIPK